MLRPAQWNVRSIFGRRSTSFFSGNNVAIMILRTIDELHQGAASARTVIVGGGTLGLYVASELVKRSHEVVVVESGGQALADFEPASYASIGKPYDGLRLGRARNLGGTSNLWGGQLVEFQSVDFAGRDWLPDSKWPLVYNEIARYHERTYANLGISAEFLDDQSVFRRAGGAMPAFTEGVEIFLTRWLQVPSFSVAYAEQINTAEGLQVLLNHTATGFTAANGQITSVQVVDAAGRRSQIPGRCFILAAGTIEISRLLLHAAATPGWDCPWRDNRNLGAYFQDHPVGRVAAVDVLDRKRFFNTFSTIVQSRHKFQPKLRMQESELQRTRILNAHGMMSFESSISENLVFLKQFLKAALYSRRISGLADLSRNVRACGKHLLPLMWKYVVNNRIFVPSTSKISFNVQCEQMPLRDSRISIDSSVTDASGLPKVVVDWRLGSEELTSIREFAMRCHRALNNAGLARLRILEDLEQMQPRFLESLHDNYHHVGGARMGETEADGVVDCNLCVFGTTNLYVAGAAAFRTTSNANTTFNALALATRLVEHLVSRSPASIPVQGTSDPRSPRLG